MRTTLQPPFNGRDEKAAFISAPGRTGPRPAHSKYKAFDHARIHTTPIGPTGQQTRLPFRFYSSGLKSGEFRIYGGVKAATKSPKFVPPGSPTEEGYKVFPFAARVPHRDLPPACGPEMR